MRLVEHPGFFHTSSREGPLTCCNTEPLHLTRAASWASLPPPDGRRTWRSSPQERPGWMWAHGSFLRTDSKWLLAAWILRSEPAAMVLIRGGGARVRWGPSGTTQLLRGNCSCRGPRRGTSRGNPAERAASSQVCVSLQKHKTVFASTLWKSLSLSVSRSLALCHLLPTADVISPPTDLLSLSRFVTAGSQMKSLSRGLPPLSGDVVQQRPTCHTSLWPASATTLKDRNEASASF